MTDNTLKNITAGAVVPNDWNQFTTALINDFIGRNGAGAAEAGKKNGTPTIPWGEVHTGALFLNGKLFDPDNLGSSSNGVISGQVRSLSQMPDFIRANGAAPSLSVLGASTNLSANIGGAGVTVTSDLTLGSLSIAPTSNNTALVNDASLTGNTASKYAGENGTTIPIDNVGSEIIDRDGQYVALKHGASEIMFARVASVSGSTAVLDNVLRGYFFDSAGAPIIREAMSNNDSLTLYNLAWLFLQDDGTTLDVTYRTPIWSYIEPATPQIDDYWFDLNLQKWMRYDGTLFLDIKRLLIGWAVMDGTNCIAARCIDFAKNFNDHVSIETSDVTNTAIRSKAHNDSVHVYGGLIAFGNSPAVWNIATDLESGLVEANSTFYYLYITEHGAPKISIERPYNRLSDLRGWYHPYHSWRYVGVSYNNSSGNLTAANSHNIDEGRVDYFTASGQFLAIPNKSIKATVVGGGGSGGSGGGGGNGGGTSSFGSFLSATGGSGGLANNIGTSGGGFGSGGDINIGGGTSSLGLHPVCGSGGASLFGGGGKGAQSFGNGFAGMVGAGGGGANNASASGGGGGSGGSSIRVLKNVYNRTSITVGGGGSSVTSNGRTSGSGGAGIVIVEYI